MAGGIGQGTPLYMPSTGDLVFVLIIAAGFVVFLWWMFRRMTH